MQSFCLYLSVVWLCLIKNVAAACIDNQLVFYPGDVVPLDDLSLFESNGECDLRLNVPLCLESQLLGECCVGLNPFCTLEGFEFLKKQSCMACLDPLRLSIPRADICIDVDSVISCLDNEAALANDCALDDPRFQVIREDLASLYGELCSNGVCGMSEAYNCIESLLSSVIQPYCPYEQDVRTCLESFSCDPEVFFSSSASKDVSRFGLCNITVESPPSPPANCTPLSIFRGLTDPLSGYADNSCDLDLNFVGCNYDGGDCCQFAIDGPCIDPDGGVLFNPSLQPCMDCYIDGPRLSDGVCEWFNVVVDQCLSQNGICFSENKFIAAITFSNEIISIACQEPECDATQAYFCLQEKVYNESITIGNCASKQDLVKQCVQVESGCSEIVTNKIIGLSPEFLVCGTGPGGIPLNCLAGAIITEEPLVLPDDYLNEECDIALNIPDCNYDNGESCFLNLLDDLEKGKCCQNITDDICIDSGSPLFNANANDCMNCYNGLNFVRDGVCGYFPALVGCLEVNNCSSFSSKFPQFNKDADIFFNEVCNQALCDGEFLYTCLNTNFQPENFTNCDDYVKSIDQCLLNATCAPGVLYDGEVGPPDFYNCLDSLNITEFPLIEECRNNAYRTEFLQFLEVEFDLYNDFCDVEFNVPECLYDNGACCDGDGDFDLCVDPSSENYDPLTASCVACYAGLDFQLDSFCGYFLPLSSCLVVNNCDNTSVIGPGVTVQDLSALATDLCIDQPGCNADLLNSCNLNLTEFACDGIEFCFQLAGCDPKVYFELFDEIGDLCVNGTNFTNPGLGPIDLFQCNLGKIQLALDEGGLDEELLGDGVCNIAYNVPECNFDAGDCCNAEVDRVCIEDGTDPQANNCMACFQNQQYDPFNPYLTVCPFYQNLNVCLNANNCGDLNPEFQALIQEAAFFSEICGDVDCDAANLFVCLSAINETIEGADGLNCETFKEIGECLDETLCSRDSIFQFLTINATEAFECFGCDLNIGIEIFQEGTEICREVVFSAELNISKNCVDSLVALSDVDDIGNLYKYDWIAVEVGRRRILNPSEQLPKTSTNKRLEIRPFLLEGLTGSLVDVSLSVNAVSNPSVNGNEFLTFDLSSLIKSPIVPRTSVLGSITLFSGNLSSSPFEIDAKRSCNPNRVGCSLCSNVGYQAVLDPGLSSNEILTATGFIGPGLTFDFEWIVSCMNPPCGLNNQTGLKFSVNQQTLDPSKSPYLITLVIIEAGSITYEASPVTLLVLDGSNITEDCVVPKVSIIPERAQLAFDLNTNKQVLKINRNKAAILIGQLETSNGELVLTEDIGATGRWTIGGIFISNSEAITIDQSLGDPPLIIRYTALQDCTSVDPFAEIEFQINEPPFGGTVTANPSFGDINTEFTLQTLGFFDTDLPLRYQFFANGIITSPLTLSSVYVTPLFGLGEVEIKVRCEDSLGAQNFSAPTTVTMQEVNLTSISLNIFSENSFQGADENKLFILSLSVLDRLNDKSTIESSPESEAFSKVLRKQAFTAARDSVNALIDQNSTTSESIFLSTKIVKSVLENTTQVDPETKESIVAVIQQLTENVKEEDIDPDDEVTEDFFLDCLEAAGKLAEDLTRTLSNGTTDSRRRLQDAICTDLKTLRDVITNLGLIRTKDDFPGTFTRTVNTSLVRFLATNVRQNRLSSLDALQIGNINVTLPQLPSNSSDTITTLFTQYDFNIRECEDTAVDYFDGIITEDDCSQLNSSVPENFTGPLSPVQGVVSLEFRQTLSQGGATALEPSGLDYPIVLRLPLGNLEDIDSGVCDNFTQLACGFFDANLNEFVTDGCEVTDISYEDGVLECSCNHASDYAVWIAFKEDVRSVFTKPLTAVTLFAILIASAVLGVVFFTYFICLVWGDTKDRRTARALQKEAVGLMVLNQVLLKQRQRQFFANLKEAVNKDRAQRNEGEIGGSSDIRNVDEKRSNPGLCMRMYLAVRYEHSLLGLARFDPHYSRVQRVSIFIAVVIGNLFVAALAFELKDSEVDDLSTTFVITVVLISSLAVALPVRFVIKMLFRMSALRQGSQSERIAQLYRISRQADSDFQKVMTNSKDVALVMAFKRMYVAKQSLELEQKAAGLVKRRCCGRRRFEASGETGMPVVEEDKELQYSLSNINSQETHEKSAEARLIQATREYEEAKKRLKEATQVAKEDWNAAPSDEAIKRVKLVSKQKSTFMKVAALVAEEAAPIAKSRRALCPWIFVYISWIILIGLYGLSVFYIVRFVLTRDERAALPEVNRTEEELIGVWLTTSAIGILVGYCIAEPIIAIVRYALLPYCVLRCGSKFEEEEEVDVLDENQIALDNKLLEKDEEQQIAKRQDGGKTQIMLEFISDLIETVY